MAQCYFCGAETRLHEFGRPICVSCSDRLEKGEQLTRKPPAKASQEQGEEPHTKERCA